MTAQVLVSRPTPRPSLYVSLANTFTEGRSRDLGPKEQIDVLLVKADVVRQQDNARLGRLQEDSH